MQNIPWGEVKFTDSKFILNFEKDKSFEISKDEIEAILTTNINDCSTVNRFVTGNENVFYFEPALPDLPIIIKPTQSISILSSKKINVYVEVPLVIKVLFGSYKNKKELFEIALCNLSKGFFGNSENGEFAYSIESPLHRNISEYSKQTTSIYCPITISNKSSQNLEFEKMILRVPYLSIYSNDTILASNPVILTFTGQEQISQISYRKTSPAIDGELRQIALPRLKEDKNIIKRSFFFIKNLYSG